MWCSLAKGDPDFRQWKKQIDLYYEIGWCYWSRWLILLCSIRLLPVVKSPHLRSPHCGKTGSVTSLKPWDKGSIPVLAQWVKDPALLQLRCRSKLWFGSGKLHVPRVAKKKKKVFIWANSDLYYAFPPDHDKCRFSEPRHLEESVHPSFPHISRPFYESSRRGSVKDPD